MKLLIFICFMTTAVCVYGGVLQVEKCKLDDVTCMTAAFQKAAPTFMSGIPEIDTEVLDILDMEDFSFDLAGLKFTLKDGKLKGMKSVTFDEVKWDLDKKYFDIDFHLDCTVKGLYTAGGRILILPITGDGQMKLKLKHVQLKFHIIYDIVKGDDGKDHVSPTKLTFDFDVKENANFQLTNLFNGNKELSEAMLIFLNENWRQISSEFGRPMIDVAAKKIFNNLKTFFKNQAIEDIAIV